jgi:hypothetical protein
MKKDHFIAFFSTPGKSAVPKRWNSGPEFAEIPMVFFL